MASKTRLALVQYSDGQLVSGFTVEMDQNNAPGAKIMLNNNTLAYTTTAGTNDANGTVIDGTDYVLMPYDGSFVQPGQMFNGFRIKYDSNANSYLVNDTQYQGDNTVAIKLDNAGFMAEPNGGNPAPIMPHMFDSSANAPGGAPDNNQQQGSPNNPPPNDPNNPPPKPTKLALVNYVSGALHSAFEVDMEPGANPNAQISLDANGDINYSSDNSSLLATLDKNTDYILVPYDATFFVPNEGDMIMGIRVKYNGAVYVVNDNNFSTDGAYKIKLITEEFHVGIEGSEVPAMIREFTVNGGSPDGTVQSGDQQQQTTDTGAVTHTDIGLYINNQEALATSAADTGSFTTYDISIQFGNKTDLGVGDVLNLDDSVAMTVKNGNTTVFTGTNGLGIVNQSGDGSHDDVISDLMGNVVSEQLTDNQDYVLINSNNTTFNSGDEVCGFYVKYTGGSYTLNGQTIPGDATRFISYGDSKFSLENGTTLSDLTLRHFELGGSNAVGVDIDSFNTTPYRYYKYEAINTNKADTNAGMAMTHIMLYTGNDGTGKVDLAGKTITSNNSIPSALANVLGDNANAFSLVNSGTRDFTIDLGSGNEAIINSYNFRVGSSGGSRPIEWSLLGSNDNSTFVEIHNESTDITTINALADNQEYGLMVLTPPNCAFVNSQLKLVKYSDAALSNTFELDKTNNSFPLSKLNLITNGVISHVSTFGNLQSFGPEIWVVFRGNVSQYQLYSGADAPLQSIWFEGIENLTGIKIMNMIYNGQNLGYFDVNGNPVISNKFPMNYVGSYNVYIKGFYYNPPNTTRIYHIQDANNTYLVDKKEVAITLNGLDVIVNNSGVASVQIPFGLNLNLNLQGWVDGFNGQISPDTEINRFFQFLNPQTDQYGNIQQYITDIEFASLMVVDPAHPKKGGGTEPKVLAQGERNYVRNNEITTSEFTFDAGTSYDIYILNFVSSRYNLKLPGTADKLRLTLQQRSIEASFTQQLYVMDYGDQPNLSFDDLHIFSSGSGGASYGHFTIKDESELNAASSFSALVFYAKDSNTGLEVGRTSGLSEFGTLTPGIHQLFADLDGSNKTSSLISVSKKKVKVITPIENNLPLLKDNYNTLGTDLDLSVIISLAKDDNTSTLLTADPAVTYSIRYNDKILTEADPELTGTTLTLASNGIIIIKAKYAGSALYLPANNSFIVTVGKKSVTGRVNDLYIKKRSLVEIENTIDDLTVGSLESDLLVQGFDDSADGQMVHIRDGNGDVTTEGVFTITPTFTYQSMGYNNQSTLGSKVTTEYISNATPTTSELLFGTETKIDIKENLDFLLHDASVTSAEIKSITVRTGETLDLIGSGVKLTLANTTSTEEITFSVIDDNGTKYLVNNANATGVSGGNVIDGNNGDAVLDTLANIDKIAISVVEIARGEIITVHTSYNTLVRGRYKVDPNLTVTSGVTRNNVLMVNKYDPQDQLSDLVVIEDNTDLVFNTQSEVQYGDSMHIQLLFQNNWPALSEFNVTPNVNGSYPNVGTGVTIPITVGSTGYEQDISVNITSKQMWIGGVWVNSELWNIQSGDAITYIKNIVDARVGEEQGAQGSLVFSVNNNNYTVEVDTTNIANLLTGKVINTEPFNGGSNVSIPIIFPNPMLRIENISNADVTANFDIQNDANSPIVNINFYNGFNTRFSHPPETIASHNIEGGAITYTDSNNNQLQVVNTRPEFVIVTGISGNALYMNLDLSNILFTDSNSANGTMVGIRMVDAHIPIPTIHVDGLSTNETVANQNSTEAIPNNLPTQQQIEHNSGNNIELVGYATAPNDANPNIFKIKIEGVSNVFVFTYSHFEITQLSI